MSETHPSLPPTPTASRRAAPTEIGPAERVLRFFGSFGLAIGILVALLVITLLGTLEQRYRGIYDVQKDYFESFFHISRTIGATEADPQGGFPFPVIGALPLLSLLFINLVVGGVMRMRLGRSTVGILIAHLGIALLLLGGLVEHMSSTNGSMSIDPGRTNNAFVSYHDWDVVVTEYFRDGSGQRFVLPQDKFADLEDGERVEFRSGKLPFDVVLSGYRRNSIPRPVPEGRADGAVNGFLLEALRPEQKAEQNTPGILATLRMQGQQDEQVLLWGLQAGPYLFEREGRQFGIDLQRHEWPIPFTLRLQRFVKEEHPGLAMAREYSSYVQKIEDGTTQEIHITMNEPLRHRGYIFYQSSFQEIGRNRDGTPVYRTILTVSVNPADRIPEIACYVISLGLLFHFLTKLFRHIKAENRRHAHAATA